MPPYHLEFNSIELIWAHIEKRVAAENITFNIDDVETLTKETFEAVPVDDWKKKCENARKCEKEYTAN